MVKAQKSKNVSISRHDPLATTINKPIGKLRAPKSQNNNKMDSNNDSDQPADLTDRISAKIIQQEKLLRKDIERDNKVNKNNNKLVQDVNTKYPISYDSDDNDDDDQYEDIEEEENEEDIDDYGEENLLQYDGDYVFNSDSNKDLSESEEMIVQKFLSSNQSNTRTLADIIFDKIREKEQEHQMNDTSVENNNSIPPKVIEVYSSIGKFLQHYKSGKLPKALKILPNLKNWEEILYLTQPEVWSSHAVYQCTKIFISNMNEKLTQKYLNIILLERCRDDIRRNYNKLNYFLYLSLKKSLFKPGAFYKGILLPLAMSNDCSLKEAMIFGSILSKVSIPANHSAVALLKLLELPYNGSNSVFIRILLNKKYALPTRVINAVVNHFYQFINETRLLPVLWHQSLLVFAQRYKMELSNEQKEKLKELLKVQCHHLITPEIRRELFSNSSTASNAMLID